jgi:hypothetical protein
MIVQLLDNLLLHVAGVMHLADVPVPERRFISPGPPPHDLCTDDMLTAWFEQVASATVPNAADGSGQGRYRFPVTNVVRLTVELARCRSELLLDGRFAPPPATVHRVAEDHARDAWVLHHALREAGAALDLDGCSFVQSDGVVPLPVQGGVVGVVGSITVQADALLPWSTP